MDKPLTRWYCDQCGEPVTAEDGYVIWDSQGTAHDFRIIHQSRCDDERLHSSTALKRLLGPDGLTHLLAWISYGPLKPGPESPRTTPNVADLDEYVDLIRRLQVPYYEEARRRFQHPDLQDNTSDWNEVSPYLTEELQGFIRRYPVEW